MRKEAMTEKRTEEGTTKPKAEGPRCIKQPCPMTMGFYIGGGQYICWAHVLTVPGCVNAIRGQKEVALVRTA